MPEDIVSKVMSECGDELKLLRQLHILAQTETLNIESQDWEQLHQIVEDKKRLVLDISKVEQRIVGMGVADLLIRQLCSREQRELLMKLREDLAGMLEKIDRVEKRNLTLLEGIKAESIRASRQIQQYQQALQSYLSTNSQIPKISKLAE